MFKRLANAVVALTGTELKKQFDERPVRFRLEIEQIGSKDGKTIVNGTFSPDFPGVSPNQRRNSDGAGRQQ